MKFIEDLIPMMLYPANKKVFAPIDLKTKQKGSAILLLAASNTVAEHMMDLSYLHNPGYFKSYYIARDVTAYIDHSQIDTGEIDDNSDAVTESFYYGTDKKTLEMNFDTSCSFSTKNKIKVFLETDSWFKKTIDVLKIHNENDISFTVYEHRSYNDLQKYVGIKGIHGYASADSIHIVSESSYTNEDGTYEHYVKHEFVSMLLHNINPEINFGISAFVSGYLSGQYKDDIKNTSSVSGSIVLADLVKKKGYGPMRTMIANNDISIIANYAGKNAIKNIMAVFEASMSSKERNSLKDSDFGIPEQRKYPLNDEAHVRAAIKMFNHVDSAHEAELAKRIKFKMKKFNITDIDVGKANKFSKYYKKSSLTESSYAKFKSNVHSEKFDNKRFKIYITPKDVRVVQNATNLAEFLNPNGIKTLGTNTMIDDDHTYTKLGIFCIDTETNVIAGCAFVYDDMLADFKVSSKYRGHSIGNEIVKNAKKHGGIYLGVADTNKVAIHLYEKNGYKLYLHDKKGKMLYYSISGKCHPGDEKTVEKIKSQNESSLLESSTNKYVEIMNDYDSCKEIFDRFSIDEKIMTCPKGYKNLQSSVYKKCIYTDKSYKNGGFIDCNTYYNNPNLVHITIAVDSRLRGTGLSDKLVTDMKQFMITNHPNKTLIWKTAHDNYPSMKLAMRHGFVRSTKEPDTFIYKLSSSSVHEFCTAPVGSTQDLKDNGYCITEDFIRVGTINDGFITFFSEAEKTYDSRIRRYIYKERLKNARSVMGMYDSVKTNYPWITRTYPNIEMYKGYNVFVDISYYNNLFLNNKEMIMNKTKAVDIYWDFMNRLINNKSIDDIYAKKTIFIPIDPGVWGTEVLDDFINYKVNTNPISIIFRMMLKNPSKIKQEWGNKTFLFVGTRGYFTVDFAKFEYKDLARFKTHLRKLFSKTEPIIDDENPKDSLAPDEDSPTVIATKVSEKIGDKLGTEVPVKAFNVDAGNSDRSAAPIVVDKADDLVFYSDASAKLPEDKTTYVALLGTSSDEIIKSIADGYGPLHVSPIKNPTSIPTYVKFDK